jgi:hypothetical protein
MLPVRFAAMSSSYKWQIAEVFGMEGVGGAEKMVTNFKKEL